jgi:lipopolysaccharide heptosyltransferase I
MNLSICIMGTSTPNFDPKKILIVLHGSIGDVIRALPLANLLRKGFPKAYLAWSVEPAARPLLEGCPAIDEIILFDRGRPWRAAWPFLAKIRSRRFDLVLDLQRHLKSGVISRYSGAPQRIGFHRSDSKEFNWLFNNQHIEPFGETVYKLNHYLKFADYLGIDRSSVSWEFAVTVEEKVSIAKHLSEVRRRFAVLFIGTRWQSKQWFPAQIAECAELLQVEHQLDVVLLGAKHDQPIAREVMALARGRVIDLVGGTSLREALGIIERADVAVGPDTGLMHVAAAVGTPVVSLWGATDPQRNGPYGFTELAIQGRAPCVPCGRRHCSIGRICMRSITKEQVAAKVEQALRGVSANEVTYGGPA